ncbi:MAG: O-antigen ligase family protein, partial [Actinobacteria bacterium]|nr:O-antigen ligase family protein [Actinomycetota bacterium]
MTTSDVELAPFRVEGRPRRFEVLLPLLLAGYLLFDRTFAHLHVPGTQLFIGEIVLLFGIAGAIRITMWEGLWQRTNVAPPAFLYAGWGLLLLIPSLFGDDPVVAVRDAAVWIYLIIALAVLAVLVHRPSALLRWFSAYRALMPLAIPWLAATTVTETLELGNVPDSDVDLTSFAPGRAEVHLLMIVGFLWLVWDPKTTRGERNRLIMTGIGVAGVLALATKGRGGFLAVIMGASLLLLLYPSRTRLIVTMSGTLLLVALATAVIDPRIDVGERELSAEQLADNVVSILTQEGEGGLGGNISWRLGHWGEIWEGVNEDVPFTGHGYGPNVAAIYHVPQTDIGLRNAHNTHLTILARSGWVGLGLWILMWGFWFQEVNATRRRLASAGYPRLSGVASWAMVGVLAIHVEAFFNPSIEGPQSAFWIWSVFALGLFLV